jgi:hypothetical protein
VIFTPFSTPITGSVQTYSSVLGSSGVILAVPVIQNASKLFNYYSGAVIKFTQGVNNFYYRIYTWTYLQTNAGFDYFDVYFTTPVTIFSDPSVATTFELRDPSSFVDSNNIIVFVPLSISAGNYYQGYYLFNQSLNQWLTISSYIGTSHLVVAQPTSTDNYTPGTWLSTHTYNIRKEIPIQYGNNLIGINTTTMTIVNTLSNYVGNFIRMIGTGEIRRIIDYNNSIVTVSPAFSAVPNGAYEILQFSRNNVNNIVYNFSEVSSSAAVCYRVTLLNVVVPNTLLKNAYGGRAIFYPFLYVALTAVSSSEGKGPNMIASNNPNSSRMLFRVLINDSTREEDSPVIRLDGNGMVQQIKVRPYDNFHFSVHRPDGTLFETEISESYSPLPPNPIVQISAIFHFERING